jgi:hypothetical protein
MQPWVSSRVKWKDMVSGGRLNEYMKHSSTRVVTLVVAAAAVEAAAVEAVEAAALIRSPL